MNPEVAYWIAQGISVITGILAILLMQLKNMKTILLFQIIVNLLAASNYFILGGDTGAIVSALAILQSVVMFVYNKKGVKPHLAVVICFVAAYVSCSAYTLFTTRDMMELLPACAAVCFSVSLVQEKPKIFRIWGALNPSFWLAYDLYTDSHVMFCVHLGILISSVVAMIRLDGLFKRKQS